MAYWLMSASTAAAAAAFSSGGQAKSGKPWARLTAPAATASRFISRMTDSVNRSALAEIGRRVMAGSLVAARDAGQTSRRSMTSCQVRRKNGSPSTSTSRSTVRSKAAASLVWIDRARISVWKS